MSRSVFAAFGIVLILAGLTGCDPVPRRTLTTDEKLADLFWVYSQFGENYAPLEYKQKKYGFDYERLKAETNDAAKATTTNDQFYAVVFKFVATFKDAHSSGALTNASLPDRAMTAYLGFSGARDGDTLLVQNRLPTITDASTYPIKKGDRILKIDGKDLRAAVNADLVQWRNLGSDEANFTYHANKLFTRVSTVNGIPSSDNAVLTVKRGDETFDVTLPWVKKDVVQFQAEQKKATDDAAAAKAKKKPADIEENFLLLADGNGGVGFKFAFLGFNGRPEFPAFDADSISRSLRTTVTAGFKFIDSFASWKLITADDDTSKTPEEIVRANRNVPEDAIFLSSAKVYPAYINREGVNLVGTIYLDTFEPSGTEDDAVAQFKQTLVDLQTLGVSRIVIDMINNGGCFARSPPGHSVPCERLLARSVPNELDARRERFRTRNLAPSIFGPPSRSSSGRSFDSGDGFGRPYPVCAYAERRCEDEAPSRPSRERDVRLDVRYLFGDAPRRRTRDGRRNEFNGRRRERRRL
jgi:hypothetical protein